MAQILGLADDFAHIVEIQELKPVEALKFFLTESNLVQKHSSNLVSSFLKIFKDRV